MEAAARARADAEAEAARELERARGEARAARALAAQVRPRAPLCACCCCCVFVRACACPVRPKRCSSLTNVLSLKLLLPLGVALVPHFSSLACYLSFLVFLLLIPTCPLPLQAEAAEAAARLTAQSSAQSYEGKVSSVTAQLQREKEEALRQAAAEADRKLAALQEKLDKVRTCVCLCPLFSFCVPCRVCSIVLSGWCFAC